MVRIDEKTPPVFRLTPFEHAVTAEPRQLLISCPWQPLPSGVTISRSMTVFEGQQALAERSSENQ
jgi:hypothetical protein